MNFVKDLLPFSESKLRPNLKMAAHRIQLVNSKKENAIKHQKREVCIVAAYVPWAGGDRGV